MMGEEIERTHAKQSGQNLPPNLGPGGVPIEVGEKNQAKKKKGRGNKPKKLTKKQLKQQQQEEADEDEQKKEKQVYYAFGKTLQLAYRLHEPKADQGATLIYNDSDDATATKKRKRGSFQQLIKLSKQIIVWCYKFDSSNPSEPDPPGGFPRPELVPISSLFRASKGDDEPTK